MNDLVYLSFGQGDHLNEVRFSIISALRFRRESHEFRIRVYTDVPKGFKGLDVEIVTLSSDQLKEWDGARNFVFRRKICTVLDAISHATGPCLYVDGDTYFARHPGKLFARVTRGHTLMHVREGHLDKYQAKPIADYLATRPNLTDTLGIPWKITVDTPMWNAGVVGIHSSDKNLVGEVLHLTDTLYAATGHVHCEQFSFSAVLALRSELRQSIDVLKHYWLMERRAPFRVLLAEAFKNGVDESRIQPLFARLPTEPLEWRLRRKIKRVAEFLHLHEDRRRPSS